jgi:hypothetical protein
LKLNASDIKTAISCIKGVNTSDEIPTIASPDNSNDSEEVNMEEADGCKKSPRNLTTQEIGIVKIPGFSEWFLNHFIMKEPADNGSLDSQSNCQKTIIFAHHLKVLDGVQVFVTEQRIKYVRIDGSTSPRERKDAVDSFRLYPEVVPSLPFGSIHTWYSMLSSQVLFSNCLSIIYYFTSSFIFYQIGNGCNYWNYCWRCWFRFLICSECCFRGAPKVSFRVASGP